MTKDAGADQSFDVAIVGGNFAGISAALYLLRARRRVVLFDDGLPRNRFAAQSHGFLGQDGVDPAVIKAEAMAQLRRYPTLTEVAGRVTAVAPGFRLDWAGGSVAARRVILASGQRDILPDVPGLAACWGKTANSCPYCHGYELADLATGILLDATPHAGLYLRQIRRWAGELTVFDHGAVLAPETLALIAEMGLAHVSGPLQAFHHDDGHVQAVTAAGVRVPVQAFYLGTTTEPATRFATDLGCEMTAGHTGPFVTVDTWQRTTVGGVYAAGDLGRNGPVAIFAASTGATAGLGCDMDLAGLL